MPTSLLLETKSLSQKFLIFLLIIQLLLIFSIYFHCYIVPTILILAGLIFFVMNNMEKSLYLMIFSLAFSQSIPALAIGGRTVGVSFDYVLLPILISAWILKRAFARERDGKEKFYFKGPIVLFVSICFISLAIASFRLSLPKLLDGILPLISWIEYIFLFFIVADLVRHPGQVEKMILLMLGFASIIALMGIAEYLLFGPSRISSSFGSFFRDMRGNPNVLGAYLAIFALLSTCLVFSFHGYRKVVFVAAALVLAGAMVLTLSRSAWVGFILGFMFVGIKKRKKFLILLPLLAVLLLLMVTPERVTDRMESMIEAISSRQLISNFLNIDYRLIESGYIGSRGIPGYDFNVIAAALRYSAWSEAINVFGRHPVFGSGFLLNKYFGRLGTAENLYLEILAGVGILGLFAFLWMFSKIVRFAMKVYKRATSDLLVHLSLGYLAMVIVLGTVSLTGSVFLNPKLLGTFWLFTGLLVSVNRMETNKENVRRDV